MCINRLEEWRKVLKGKGLRISMVKTEYMGYDFGKVNTERIGKSK